MLTRFSVRNYKCLRDVTLPLTPFHVLIGENDAGKSSFLEAIAAYCASSRSLGPTIRNSFEAIGFGADLVGTYTQSAEHPLIEFAGWWGKPGQSTEDSLEYGFAFEIVSEQTANIAKEYVRKAPGSEQALQRDPNNLAFAYYTANPASSSVSDRDRSILKDLSAVFQTADLYSLNPRIMARPSVKDAKLLFKMESDGFGLANLLDDILGADPERYLKLQGEFCRYFPQFRRVQLLTIDGYRRLPGGGIERAEGNAKGIFFVTEQEARIPARRASDGAILFLAYLALSYVPEPPGILLLEEPENSVYPKRLREIIDLLRRYASDSSGKTAPQIIMTTHSPFVVSCFEPEEVSFFYRSREEASVAQAKPLRDVPGLKERLKRDELYLGELWYNWEEEAWLGIPSGQSSD